MSIKQLALFRRSARTGKQARVERTPAKPKHKYGAAITDYGTLREWERDLTPCERRRYGHRMRVPVLTPFQSGRTYATFYQLKTTPWGWLGREYEQGSNRMHIRLFRRNER